MYQVGRTVKAWNNNHKGVADAQRSGRPCKLSLDIEGKLVQHARDNPFSSTPRLIQHQLNEIAINHNAAVDYHTNNTGDNTKQNTDNNNVYTNNDNCSNKNNGKSEISDIIDVDGNSCWINE